MIHAATHEQFRHEAFFYADDDEFLDGTASFIRDGLDHDEPSLVVLNAAKIAELRSELNEDADRVLFADMAEVGANPARIIPAWREFVDGHRTASRSLRGIGEPIWAERRPAELVECQRHESLLNLAFAEARGFYLLCSYDTSALPDDVLEEAHRSHAFLAADGEYHESDHCRSLDEVAAAFAEPLPEPAASTEWHVFQAGTLSAVRDFVTRHAVDAGLDERGTEDLVLAANEVATNSVAHGGGGGILRIWEEDDALICEVDDRGRIVEPMAGRERPDTGQIGGYGLWIANQVCDLVQVRTFGNGSAVRLHKRRAPVPAAA